MKFNKIFLFTIFSLFLPISVLAVAMQNGQGIHEPGTGIQDPELKQEMQAEVVGVTVDSDAEVVVMNQNQNMNKQGSTDTVGIKAQVQEQNQIHEVGTGQENPELKEMNQEQNQLQINKDVNATNSQNKKGSNRSLERRSEVANAVQEMLQVANRNGGIGEQIREVAQNQNQLQNNIENSLEKVQNQNRFMRFLIGPNYDEIAGIKTNLENQIEKVEKIKELKNNVSEEDEILLENQIEKVEELVAEVKTEIKKEESSFSLFGWLKRLF